MASRRLSGLIKVGEWRLAAKILATVLVGIVVVGAVVAVVSAMTVRQTMEREVQARFATLATGKMESVANLIQQQFATLRVIAADEAIIAAAQAANAEHSSASALSLSSIDQTWETATDDSELVRSITDPRVNATTDHLLSYIEDLPEYQLILVTDRLGGLLAATTRTDHFFQAYQPWWTPTYNNGQGNPHVNLVTPQTDPAGHTYLEFAVPIYAGESGEEVIGGVYARMTIQALTRALQSTGGVQGTLITDQRGRVLAATDAGMVGTTVDPTWSERGYQLNRNRHSHEAVMAGGTDVLLGHTSMPFMDVVRGDDAATLNGLGWILFVYEPFKSAYAEARRANVVIGAWGAGALLVAAVGSYIVAQSLVSPIQHLISIVGQIRAGGDRARVARAWTYARHEAGVIGSMINDLLDEREALEASLADEREGQERERQRRLRDARLTAAVGDVISVADDEQKLSQRVAELVHEHYSLYFVGLYFADEAGRWAVLQAGTGEAGDQLLARAHRVEVGTGIVGECVANGRQRVERDLSSIARADADVLPYARSEVAVPLRSRGRVLGAVVALSYQSDTFGEELTLALQAIADQVAVAVESMRLFNESRAASERLQAAYGELSRQAWRETLGTHVGYGYEARVTGVKPLDAVSPDQWTPGSQQAWRENRTVSEPLEEAHGVETQTLAVPIRSRGEVIGVLDVAKLAQDGALTPVEMEQLMGLADQLGQALENARLYEVTQQSALEQEMVSQVTRRMRETLSVDTVLQTAVRELQGVLGLEAVEIRVAPGGGQASGEAGKISGEAGRISGGAGRISGGAGKNGEGHSSAKGGNGR